MECARIENPGTGRTDKATVLSPQTIISSKLSRNSQLQKKQPKCLRQLAHRTELPLLLHQAQAAITAAATAIPTAIGIARARARALRTDQTDTDQTVTTAIAKTKTAGTMSDDTEMLQRNQSCFLTKPLRYQGAT